VSELPGRLEGVNGERRAGRDRRSRSWYALLAGAWRARRRNLRRAERGSLGYVDWHAPQWFAAAVLVLILSLADTFLTLVLLQHGAIEINPLMRAFVDGDGREFAFVKLALTAWGVAALVVLARVPVFSRYIAGPVLVAAAVLYLSLVGYELWLLGWVVA
jgi:Domain of unknown function (DUF5658)